jgi:hypothetical protein
MVVAALWLVLFGVLDAIPGLIVISLFGAAPLIVATAADERRTAIFAGATVPQVRPCDRPGQYGFPS